MAKGITKRKNADGSFSHRAEVWDNARSKRLTKTFPTPAAAKSWRSAMIAKVKSGEAGAFEATTIEQAAWCLLVAMREGRALDRSGKPYKTSVRVLWESKFRRVIIPKLGRRKLTELRTVHLQEFVDELAAEGLAPSTIQGTILPLRVLYRFALRYERCANNPTRELSIPSGEKSRDRVASPAEAAELIVALKSPVDKAIYGVAFYAGLRRGELLALEVENIDFKNRTIHVGRSWDAANKEFTNPKTAKGKRTVPIPSVLLPLLMAVRPKSGLMFPREPGSEEPISEVSLRRRAARAWEAAGLEQITLHECRHTYASYMIAAGVNAKALSTYMGHATITITLDRYGHLMPGNESEAAELLDTYLTSRTTKSA